MKSSFNQMTDEQWDEVKKNIPYDWQETPHPDEVIVVNEKDDFMLFLEELEKEWPPQRVQEFLLERMRNKCKWYAAKAIELELANRDARMRGVSFKERQSFTVKIAACKKLFAESRAMGVHYKKYPPSVAGFVKPYDMAFIAEKSLERQLILATM